MYKNPQIEAVFITWSTAAEAARVKLAVALDDSVQALLGAMDAADNGITYDCVVDWEVSYKASVAHQEAMRALLDALSDYQKAAQEAFLAATREHQRAFHAAYEADARRAEAAAK